MIYQVRHATILTYAAPVQHAQFNLRLRPVEWPGQQLQDHALALDPVPPVLKESAGPYAVNTTLAAFAQPLGQFTVTSRFTIAITPPPPPGPGPAPDAIRQAALVSPDLTALSPVPYLYPSRLADIESEIGDWAAPALAGHGGIVEAARALCSAIHREFSYEPGATTSATAPLEAFRARRGVCQDFAHVMLIALRAHGLPAAYASGYLRTQPPPGMDRLVGADAMHAWAMVWCGDDLGWIGFDPTNDCLARADHILVAMGRDYADVAPIDGVFIGSAPQSMQVAVDVVPLETDME